MEDRLCDRQITNLHIHIPAWIGDELSARIWWMVSDSPSYMHTQGSLGEEVTINKYITSCKKKGLHSNHTEALRQQSKYT